MYKWNEDKGTLLKSQRGFGFYDVLLEMQENGVMDHFKHPNSEKYPDQYIYVVKLGGYTHYVPYVRDGEDIFLKNIIPSRKMHKKYKEQSQ